MRRRARTQDRPRRVPASLIREIPHDERPRERLLRCGPQALSDAELLAILLCSGCAGLPVLELARDLLRQHGGLAGLLGAGEQGLQRRGIGEAKAAAVLAAFEIACRLAQSEIPDREPLNRPALVARYLSLRYVAHDQEILGAIFLDTRQRLIGEREIYRGTLTRAAAEPRGILKEALLRGAAEIVLFHTHPSGDVSPSAEELAFTRRMAKAGELLGIRLLDHLILGSGGRWVSLRQREGW